MAPRGDLPTPCRRLALTMANACSHRHADAERAAGAVWQSVQLQV
jgi:hypothetical protein